MKWKGLALLRPHKTGPVRLQPTPPPPLEMLMSEDLKCVSSVCLGYFKQLVHLHRGANQYGLNTYHA